MTLVKWHPMRGLISPEREMERFFGNFWDESIKTERNWSPRMDLAESESGFEVVVEIPGMRKEDIEIKFQDKVLTLKGERVRENDEKKQYHRQERAYGQFERSFYLPEDIKVDEIKANYKDGLLTVEIPKSEKVKPKEIAIH